MWNDWGERACVKHAGRRRKPCSRNAMLQEWQVKQIRSCQVQILNTLLFQNKWSAEMKQYNKGIERDIYLMFM